MVLGVATGSSDTVISDGDVGEVTAAVPRPAAAAAEERCVVTLPTDFSGMDAAAYGLRWVAGQGIA
eukprot:10940400-Alexandrium_andersonii.AAC.1